MYHVILISTQHGGVPFKNNDVMNPEDGFQVSDAQLDNDEMTRWAYR